MIKNGKKICIFGAGGFGRETLCCLIDQIAPADSHIGDVACFMVDDKHLTDKKVLGIDVLPKSAFNPDLFDVVVAISDPPTRKKVVESLPPETSFATIIHPDTVISEWVDIGEGSVITAGVIITCNIKIGEHSHLNLYTTIGHDCTTGDFFTTAPGANISGMCEFGERVYIGSNASVRQGVSICDDVTIGMGAVVVKSISEQGTYIGNPLKKLNI